MRPPKAEGEGGVGDGGAAEMTIAKTVAGAAAAVRESAWAVDAPAAPAVNGGGVKTATTMTAAVARTDSIARVARTQAAAAVPRGRAPNVPEKWFTCPWSMLKDGPQRARSDERRRDTALLRRAGSPKRSKGVCMEGSRGVCLRVRSCLALTHPASWLPHIP